MKGWQHEMNKEEITLINLYISLQVATAKRDLFESKGCGVPETLEWRIRDLKAKIAENESKVAA